MPFIDLNTKHPSSFFLPSTDIVIIGGGTAGILLAVTLTLRGKSVSIIETGDLFEDEEKQRLNSVEQTGKIVKNAVWGRKRVLGGTTVSWGGQSLPFTPIDFEKRNWIQNSGWPISFSDIELYYKQADDFMGIDTMNHSTDIFPKIKLNNPGIDPLIFDFHVAKWTNNTNFYLQHKQFLREKVFVLYNAQLTKISKNYNGVIDSIEVTNFKSRQFIFPVNKLIIAAGTIETVRILLHNNLGNHSGLLGKYFMEHPCIEVGTIITNNEYRLHRNFNTHIWKGMKYSIRLTLGQRFQKQNQLLNCSASIMFRPQKKSLDIYAELKYFKKDFKLRRLIKISRYFKSILKSTRAYLIDRFYYKSKAISILSLMIEQEPIKDSYITLSSNKDQFSIPKALINWMLTEKTWETAIVTANIIKKQIEDLDLGKVDLHDYIEMNNPQWENYLSDVCHNMGGCRMSSSPEEGVVDKNLQVWQVPNLFICSQAVFPTGSHSNPVLTMLALAIRLTDYLSINHHK